MKKTLVAGGILLLSYLLIADENGRRLVNQYSANLIHRVTFALSSEAADQIFREAFAERRSNFVAEGRGIVSQLLDDDQDGDRHQRFIVQLSSGQTLLVVHNIDIAPRITSLNVGDTVEFKGEYEWNDRGGVMHWTHRDPKGQHIGGWILHGGTRYE